MKIHAIIALTIISLWDGPAANATAGDKTSLSGIVSDAQSHQPVPGATIYFPDLRTGTISRADGTYSIEDLPSAKVLVRVGLVGYSTIVRTIDLTTVMKMDFMLEPSVTELAEAVVTGTTKATELRRDPAPTVLVPRSSLEQNVATNVIESLKKVPGVSTLTTGPNVSKPYIRGLGHDRVLTLYDGMRQEGQQWGDEHGIEVDRFLIDRIEVVKGPASLMYGSDALAGVVNLLPAHPAAPGTIAGELRGDHMTNNKQIAGSLALNGNGQGLIWGGRVSHEQATNYRNRYDGRVAGTKFKENDLNAYIGLNRSWGYAHLALSIFDDQQEIPDGSRDSTTRAFTQQISEEDTIRPIISDADLNSYSIGVLHQRVQHYRLNAANGFVLGQSRLNLNLAYQRSIRREFDHPAYPGLAGLYLILNTFSYDLKFHLPERAGWETTFGVNGMVQQNAAEKGTELVIPNYDNFDLGPFAHTRRSFGKLDLAAGVRFDLRRFNSDAMYTRTDPATGFDMEAVPSVNDTTVMKPFDAHEHMFTGGSGSMGVAYNVHERLTIKANIARGYRAPNAAEITARGVHPGTGFQQLGDANLKPESNLQGDVGIFFRSTHVTCSVEFFNNSISNYIYDEKLAGVNGGDSLFTQDGNVFPVFKYRQTKANLHGGEFGLDLHPHPLDWLHFENSLSFVYAENKGGQGAVITDSTKYLPFIPPFHTNSELRATVRRRIGPFSDLFVKVGMEYFAGQDRFYGANGTETCTPSYTLFDAGVGGRVMNRRGGTLFSLSVLASNLADRGYQSNMDRLKYMEDYPVNGTGRSGIFDMGRNIIFKLVVPIEVRKEKAPPDTARPE